MRVEENGKPVKQQAPHEKEELKYLPVSWRSYSLEEMREELQAWGWEGKKRMVCR